jgi:Ceramidase
MRRSPWLTAAFATALFALVAATLAWWAEGKFAWGKPDAPKAQCEALDAASLAPAPAPTAVAANAPDNALVPAAAPVVAPATASIARAARYQARVATAIIREPQDTWSNLAFVFVGALIAAHDRRVTARLLGAALIALGLGSGLYHASLRPVWRGMDVATMAWVSFALCCHGFATIWPRADGASATARRRLWFGVIGAALVMTAAIFRNDVRVLGVKPFNTVYMTQAGIATSLGLMLVGVVRARRARPEFRLPFARLALAVVVVAVALACQLNDHPGRCFCAPESPVQAHAVWHVLMAAAIAMTYDFFAVLEGGAPLGRRGGIGET